MPVWRCPHCGTPQAESSRCWVCRRSTTTCATCRHFRRGIASGLGLCGLDPRRAALDGTEIRSCWVATDPRHAGSGEPIPLEPAPALDGARDGRPPARTFVPVDDLDDSSRRPAAAVVGGRSAADTDDRAVAAPSGSAPAPSTGPGATAGWSLWGDPEA
jgi:hypothetical protein